MYMLNLHIDADLALLFHIYQVWNIYMLCTI